MVPFKLCQQKLKLVAINSLQDSNDTCSRTILAPQQCGHFHNFTAKRKKNAHACHLSAFKGLWDIIVHFGNFDFQFAQTLASLINLL